MPRQKIDGPIVNSVIRTASGDGDRVVLPDSHPDVITTTEFMGLPAIDQDRVAVWLALPEHEFNNLVRVQICPDGMLLCHFRQIDPATGETVLVGGNRVCVGKLRRPDPRFTTPPWYGTSVHTSKRLGHTIGVDRLIVGDEPDPEKDAWEARRGDQ